MKRYKLKRDTPAFKAGTECYIEEAGHMVPCRGISYVIVHKDQLEKNPNILTDWFEEVNESNRWKPETRQNYYCVTSDGLVYNSIWADDSIDSRRFDIGNCFQTEEEAKRVAEYLKALAVVRGDATSEFVKYNDNWFIGYDPEHKTIDAFCNPYTARNGIFGLPYFATEDDARRSIEQHMNEWLTIFGVKEEV